MKHPDFKDIDGVITQVERINGIVRNLMWKSRQEQDTSYQEIDLNQLLQEELRFLEADMDFKHNVEKQFQFADDVPAIAGRYSDFSQSIMNVVRNALDAMHALDHKMLRVTTEVRDGDVRLSITDVGCGISAENRDKLFVPFYTTKPLAGRDGGQPSGTGLGLSTAQRLLDSLRRALRHRQRNRPRHNLHLLHPHRGQFRLQQVRIPQHGHGLIFKASRNRKSPRS